MSLSLLLDYRQEDSKEHSFEVSLFAELFNEMLIRDFGFSIYKALYELPDKLKEGKKEKNDKKDRDKEKEEKDKTDEKHNEEHKKIEEVDDKKADEKSLQDENQKEDFQKSDVVKQDNLKDEEENKEKKETKDRERVDSHKEEKHNEESDFEDDEEKKKDRKGSKKDKKEKLKLYTKDKHLLLSFVYFDQSHCGYIFDKDIEDLLYTLGLKLSRAQIRKLVAKIVVRDCLHYRKLTDKPKEIDVVSENLEQTLDWEKLAVGNRKYLPIFKKNEPKDRVDNHTDSTDEQGKI